jgi:DNA modification methylase
MSANFDLHLGDCLETLRGMADNSVDAVVTDPPYGLTANKKGGTGVASINLDSPYGRARIGTGNGPGGFMGHKWDSDVPSAEIWAECLRVLKPGGHLLAFAGTRTQHRMAVCIEDAGFEIRDMIAWVYGSGFPKSRNIAADMEESYNATVWQG